MSGSPAAPLSRARDTIRSSSFRYDICCANVDTPRSKPRVAMATFQPSPGAATTLSPAVRASSKKISLKSASPVIWRIGRTVIPFCRKGTSKYDNPWLPRLPASVRARTNIQSANCASEVQIFCPLMTHASPPGPCSSRADVRTFARSEPALGSL